MILYYKETHNTMYIGSISSNSFMLKKKKYSSEHDCSIISRYKPFNVHWLHDAPISLTFNICTLCPHCIYVFCIYLRTNSDLCHLQHKLTGFYNRDLTLYSPVVTICTASLTFSNCTLCPHCIYVFCIYLRTNSDLCHLQYKLIGFHNRDEKCLQRGTDWGFK